MRKRNIFICIFAISLLINVIPLLIFRDKAAVSINSLLPILTIICMSFNGVRAFLYRHIGNYLELDRHRLWTYIYFSEEKDYTYTEEYEREFFWQFCLYWFAVPFYIPCIYFVSGPLGSLLWTACVTFTPQLVYFIYDIANAIKAEKEYQIRKKKQEQELKEQMLREELGHIK